MLGDERLKACPATNVSVIRFISFLPCIEIPLNWIPPFTPIGSPTPTSRSSSTSAEAVASLSVWPPASQTASPSTRVWTCSMVSSALGLGLQCRSVCVCGGGGVVRLPVLGTDRYAKIFPMIFTLPLHSLCLFVHLVYFSIQSLPLPGCTPLQGNMDPGVLYGNKATIEARVMDVIKKARSQGVR